MNNIETSMLLVQLQSQVRKISAQLVPVDVNMVLHIREGVAKVVQQISTINSSVSSRLDALKDALFTETSYQQFTGTTPVCQFLINPIVCGQMIEALEFAKSIANQDDCGICHLLHPDIQRVSEKLYKDGSYANSACDAFIEIDSRLQKIYREKRPNAEKDLSGQSLMNKIFADKDPLFELGDLTTQTGRDIQSGTRFMFAGAMGALRNPKSHKNINLGKEDCMRRLIFASMLMYKVDELVAHSDING